MYIYVYTCVYIRMYIGTSTERVGVRREVVGLESGGKAHEDCREDVAVCGFPLPSELREV